MGFESVLSWISHKFSRKPSPPGHTPQLKASRSSSFEAMQRLDIETKIRKLSVSESGSPSSSATPQFASDVDPKVERTRTHWNGAQAPWVQEVQTEYQSKGRNCSRMLWGVKGSADQAPAVPREYHHAADDRRNRMLFQLDVVSDSHDEFFGA